MATDQQSHCMPWSVSSQPLEVDFTAGCLVEDAGLLAVRCLDVQLGVLTDLARRLPDPRSPRYIRHSLESLLVQFVYQFLAGYPDGNDAEFTRHDALFQILQGIAPHPTQALACTSTLNRFLYGYTRRDAELPRCERPSLLQQRRAQVKRLRVCNGFLVDLFVRTRAKAPAQIVLDLDATDDPVHGHQPLSAYHGYYRQHQYLPTKLLLESLETVKADLNDDGVIDTSEVFFHIRTGMPALLRRLGESEDRQVPVLFPPEKGHPALGIAARSEK